MDDQTRQQEAANLNALIKDLNWAKFARDFSVPGGASMIYQHATGRRAISLNAGLAYAKGLGCALESISPRLAQLAQSVRNSTEDIPLQARTLTPAPLPEEEGKKPIKSSHARRRHPRP